MTITQTPATQVASGNTATTQYETHQITSSAPTIPPGSILTQVGSVLGVVILLILCGAWLVRKLGFAPQARSSKLLSVRGSCQLGQRERVVIVEVDNTWLVLGVTAHQVTPLHVLPTPPVDLSTQPAETAKPVDFRQLLHKIIKNPGKSA